MTKSSIAKTLSSILLCFLVGCSFSIPDNNHPQYGNSEVHISRCGNKEFHFVIDEKEVSSFPSWTPDQPPILSVSSAVQIAKQELPKYTKTTNGWILGEVSLTRVRVGSHSSDKWLYLVNFSIESNHDYIRIPVTFSGKPIQGIEQPLNKSHQ